MACYFLMVVMVVQLLRIVVISFLPPIVLFLELWTCNHLTVFSSMSQNLLGVLCLMMLDHVLIANSDSVFYSRS
jgi:hypothetical protein